MERLIRKAPAAADINDDLPTRYQRHTIEQDHMAVSGLNMTGLGTGGPSMRESLLGSRSKLAADAKIPPQSDSDDFQLGSSMGGNPPCNTIYISNLPLDASENELKAIFSKERGFKRLMFRAKQDGPVCFVEFEDVDCAVYTVLFLDGGFMTTAQLGFAKHPLGVRPGHPTVPSPSKISSRAQSTMSDHELKFHSGQRAFSSKTENMPASVQNTSNIGTVTPSTGSDYDSSIIATSKPTQSDIERDTLSAFKAFAAGQRKNVDEVRTRKAKNDKTVKLNDLKKFSDNFKLNTPVPSDLVSIIAKDPAKQEEIGEKARSNAGDVTRDSNASASESDFIDPVFDNYKAIMSDTEATENELFPDTSTTSGHLSLAAAYQPSTRVLNSSRSAKNQSPTDSTTYRAADMNTGTGRESRYRHYQPIGRRGPDGPNEGDVFSYKLLGLAEVENSVSSSPSLTLEPVPASEAALQPLLERIEALEAAQSPHLEQPPRAGVAQHSTQTWVNQTVPNTKLIEDLVNQIELNYRHQELPDHIPYTVPPPSVPQPPAVSRREDYAKPTATAVEGVKSPAIMDESDRVSTRKDRAEQAPKIKSRRASRPKVKTGCNNCKSRRVKCDETRPQCNKCVRSGRTCDGYPAYKRSVEVAIPIAPRPTHQLPMKRTDSNDRPAGPLRPALVGSKPAWRDREAAESSGGEPAPSSSVLPPIRLDTTRLVVKLQSDIRGFLVRQQQDVLDLQNAEEGDGSEDHAEIIDTEEESSSQSMTRQQAEERQTKQFRLSHQQTEFLLKEFTQQPHPNASYRERLSKEIPGITSRQIQVWFQNRRAKMMRLSADERERMKENKEVPENFDIIQALQSPVKFAPRDTDHILQPLKADPTIRDASGESEARGGAEEQDGYYSRDDTDILLGTQAVSRKGQPTPLTLKEEVAKGDLSSVCQLLEEHFSDVANDDFDWLHELLDIDCSYKEMAKLLIDGDTNSPWILLDEPVTLTANMVPGFHQNDCVHHGGRKVKNSPQITHSRSIQHSATKVKEAVSEYCGLAGVVPPDALDSRRDTSSVQFDEGNSIAAIRYRDDWYGATDSISRISKALEKILHAVGFLQAQGLCCDSITILRITDTLGPIELCKVEFSLLKSLQGVLEAWQNNLDDLTLRKSCTLEASRILKIFVGENEIDADIYLSLVPQCLHIAIVSYIQAHIGGLHPSFLVSELRELRLFGSKSGGAAFEHVVVELLDFTCMRDMVKGPALVFRSSGLSLAPNRPRFDLLASPEDIADTWGPARFVTNSIMRHRALHAIEIGGGTISRPTPNSDQLHWTSGQSLWEGHDRTFHSRRKILIAGITINAQCPLDETKSWLHPATHAYLKHLGTYDCSWELREKQVGFQGGQYAVLAFNATYIKQNGVTLKQRQLMLPFNEIDLAFLNSSCGLQISFCTGIARRVPLRVLLADVMEAFVESRVSSKPLNWEELKTKDNIVQNFRTTNLERWFNDLSTEKRESALHIVRRMLDVLKDTGIDKNGEELVIAWVRKGSSDSCLRLRCEKTSLWARILADSEDCATFACITPLCLQSEKHKCRHLEAAPWHNVSKLLDTAVCPQLSNRELTTVASTLAPFELQHQVSYWIGKSGSNMIAKVWLTAEDAEPFLLVKQKVIPEKYRARMPKSMVEKLGRLRERQASETIAKQVMILTEMPI